MKHSFIRNIRFVAIAPLCIWTSVIFAQNSYQLTQDVNVRSGGGTAYDVIGKINQGTTVTLDSSIDGNWTPISLANGERGYISTKYLSPASSNSGTTQRAEKPLSTFAKIIMFLFFALLVIVYLKFRKTKVGRAMISSFKALEAKREAYEAKREASKATCKYCGREESSIFTLTRGYCDKSPHGHHVPY